MGMIGVPGRCQPHRPHPVGILFDRVRFLSARSSRMVLAGSPGLDSDPPERFGNGAGGP